MELSLYSSVCRNHPFGLFKAIEWASEFGYDSIDIRGASLYTTSLNENSLKANGYDMLNPELITDEGLEDLKKYLELKNITISSISSYMPLIVSTEEQKRKTLEMMRKYLKIASFLGAPWIRTYGNDDTGEMDMNEMFNSHVDLLKELTPDRDETGVGILIETNENTVTPDIQTCLNVKKAVGSKSIGIVIDPINLYFSGKTLEEVDEQLKIASGEIAMIHVKNARVTNEAVATYKGTTGTEFVWTALDEGDIDWERYLKRAISLGFDGPLVYEYANPFKGMSKEFWEAIPDAKTLSEHSEKFLRRIITQA